MSTYVVITCMHVNGGGREGGGDRHFDSIHSSV